MAAWAYRQREPAYEWRWRQRGLTGSVCRVFARCADLCGHLGRACSGVLALAAAALCVAAVVTVSPATLSSSGVLSEVCGAASAPVAAASCPAVRGTLCLCRDIVHLAGLLTASCCLYAMYSSTASSCSRLCGRRLAAVTFHLRLPPTPFTVQRRRRDRRNGARPREPRRRCLPRPLRPRRRQWPRCRPGLAASS